MSRQNQRLGDMAAGTLVVRDREIDTPHWGELGARTITGPAMAAAATEASWMAPPHLSVVLSTAAVARLSAADLEVLEGFFARRLDLDLATRAALAERIAAALRAKSGLEIPEGTSTETFLESVAHRWGVWRGWTDAIVPRPPDRLSGNALRIPARERGFESP